MLFSFSILEQGFIFHIKLKKSAFPIAIQNQNISLFLFTVHVQLVLSFVHESLILLGTFVVVVNKLKQRTSEELHFNFNWQHEHSRFCWVYKRIIVWVWTINFILYWSKVSKVHWSYVPHFKFSKQRCEWYG